MKRKVDPGETLIDGDNLQGLIPSIQYQSQINEFEAANIAEAELWAFGNGKFKNELLTATGLMKLHKKMFSQVWTWAGQFRRETTNIGVEIHQIQNELRRLLGDVEYWIKNQTFPVEEIAIRFHHRLVWIHPFRNGNGRFARTATNLLLEFLGEKRFS